MAFPTIQPQIAIVKEVAVGNKYDYREEWARFVSALSYVDEQESDQLAVRIVHAVGGVVAATGGALWLHEAGTSFRLAAKVNYTRGQCGSGDAPVLAVWLVTHDEILDLAAGEHEARMVDLPDWLPSPPAGWLLLPLHHRGWMVGFLVLQSQSPQRLDPEDRELLRLVAHNAASYLTEDEKSRQLREARAFERFTRKFAFVMHDLKNMSAQLALTLSNAHQHKANPEFVADMIDTVDGAVSRMNGLIARLGRESDAALTPFLVGPVLDEVVGERRSELLVGSTPWRHLLVAGDPGRLKNAIDHMVDNAMQSRPRGGKDGPATVRLGLRAVAGEVRIEIADDGDGMDDSFIQEQLFTPFYSTKPTGFGLGMSETREIIEQMNGRVLIESEPGAGTTVTLCLPRVSKDPQ